MTLRWLIAALHLLALPLGLGGVWMRGRALSHARLDTLKAIFAADNAWGVAALLWILTGAARAFGGLEKGSAYYLHSHAFRAKMGLFALIFILEIRPMVTLIRWRRMRGRGRTPDLTPAPGLARISFLQAFL